MRDVLITAFEPYDHWQANASWLTLVELTKQVLPPGLSVTTRLYPVDFGEVTKRLAEDLANDYDVALHLGQAPGSAGIRLESIGLNVAGSSRQRPEECWTLTDDGPVAFRSQLPLARFVEKLREARIPAQVSFHAGTHLCNATLYMTHYLTQQQKRKTHACFIHVPLDTSQAIEASGELPSLPASESAEAVRLILRELAT
jgi:pyroglutamyl-peptidase